MDVTLKIPSSNLGRLLTLKVPGFLVTPRTGGGVESTHFGKRPLTPPHFHSRPTNSISYESWHILLKFDTLLRLQRFKLRPREVAEVARVQTKKINQKFWNLPFLSYKIVIHLKRKLRIIVIQIWNKIREFCTVKIEKKVNFAIFDPKKSKCLVGLC